MRKRRNAVRMWLLSMGLLPMATSVALAEGPAVVRIWNYNVHDKKYTQKMYKLFNQRNPDVKIEYSSITIGVYPQVLEAAFAAKELPELFLPGSGSKLSFEYLKDRGLLMPLNQVAPTEAEFKEWISRFPLSLHKFVEGVTVFNGNAYIVDLSGKFIGGGGDDNLHPLFYNKTLFKEAGIAKPPATQSELRQTAAKLTTAGAGKSFGIVQFMDSTDGGAWDYAVTASMARAAGVRTFDLKDGRWHYGHPEAMKALQTWIDMRKDASVFPGQEQMSDEQAKMLFATNKAAMQFGGWWNVSGYFAYNPDADFDLVLPPAPNGGVRRDRFYVNPLGGANGYVVPSTVKNPKAVWEVIKFISSLEFQDGYVQGGYGVSYLPEANKASNFTIPQMYQFVKWANDPALRRIIPPTLSEGARKAMELQDPVYPGYQEVFLNVYEGYRGFDSISEYDRKRDAAVDAGIKKAQELGFKVTRSDFAFPDWNPDEDYVPKKR